MEMIYATLIINGKKTINDVPKILRDKVKVILVELGLENLIL